MAEKPADETSESVYYQLLLEFMRASMDDNYKDLIAGMPFDKDDLHEISKIIFDSGMQHLPTVRSEERHEELEAQVAPTGLKAITDREVKLLISTGIMFGAWLREKVEE